MPSATDDLARTRSLFEQWRSTRPGHSKIPEELRQAAAALQGRYSASQLCRELHLSAGALRSRLREATPQELSPQPVFVPLPIEPLIGSAPLAAEIRLVWERADGTRLHLCLPSSHWSQAAALCQAFLRS